MSTYIEKVIEALEDAGTPVLAVMGDEDSGMVEYRSNDFVYHRRCVRHPSSGLKQIQKLCTSDEYADERYRKMLRQETDRKLNAA